MIPRLLSKNEGDADNQVFSELFDDFYTQLLRIACRICDSSEVAEELCQETFLRYYERRKRLPQGIEARYWLIRVVKNLALSHEKRIRRERKAYLDIASKPMRESLNQGEIATLSDESRKYVQEALLRVPYKLRVPLILKAYAEYPYSIIAQILHISENNVKIRIFRARQHLSKYLKKEDLYVP